MTIAVRNYSSGAEIVASYHAVRQRLMKPANAFRPSKALAQPKVVNLAAEPPLWQGTAIEFDEHTKNWQFHRAMAKSRRHEDYIRRRCTELCISYVEIVSSSSLRSITGHRQLIMYELKTKFGLPYEHIGRLFGRDHTTVISAVKRITKINGEPMPEKSNHLQQLLSDRELNDTMKAAYKSGVAVREMSVEFKLSEQAIYAVIKIENWSRDKRNRNGSSAPMKVNIAEMRADYEKGVFTITRIANEHGVSVRTVRRLAEANGWTRKDKE